MILYINYYHLLNHSIAILADGAWGPWGPFDSCTKSCAGGTRTRTKSCVGHRGGGYCPGSLPVDVATCNTNCCPGWLKDDFCPLVIKMEKILQSYLLLPLQDTYLIVAFAIYS